MQMTLHISQRVLQRILPYSYYVQPRINEYFFPEEYYKFSISIFLKFYNLWLVIDNSKYPQICLIPISSQLSSKFLISSIFHIIPECQTLHHIEFKSNLSFVILINLNYIRKIPEGSYKAYGQSYRAQKQSGSLEK